MVVYINKSITNSPWGAECLINKAFRELNFHLTNIDYQTFRYGLVDKIGQAYAGGRMEGAILQRGTGYLIPKSVIELLPRPRILLLTELTQRVLNQSYLWSDQLFDFFYVRTPACKLDLVANFGISPDKIEVFLSAYDNEIFFKKKLEKDIDILFVGAITSRRKVILDELKTCLGEKLVVTTAYAQELNDLLNRSKIVLNIHGADLLDTETRVFEVLGAGAFLITEKLSEESPFASGVHLVEVNGVSDLIPTINKFLDDVTINDREAIAQQGHQFVLAKHRYTHRAAILRDHFAKMDGFPLKAPNTKWDYFTARLDEFFLKSLDSIKAPALAAYHKLRTSK